MLNRSNWASFLTFFMCYLCDFQRGSSSKAATSPAENYNLARRRTLQVVVSALLTECGFESAEKVAVETLTEMMQSCTYIYPYPVCWCHQNHIQYSFLKNYGSPVGQWTFFLKSDLNCFLSCVYDLRTAGIICLHSLLFCVKPSVPYKRYKQRMFCLGNFC